LADTALPTLHRKTKSQQLFQILVISFTPGSSKNYTKSLTFTPC